MIKFYKFLPIILLSLKAYASEDLNPKKDFRCFVLANEINLAYKTSNQKQVSHEIKKLVRENLRIKWAIYDQLAKKINKQIDDINEYQQIFQIIDLTKNSSRIAYKFEYNCLDTKLDLLIEPLSLPQRKLFLALIHRAILNHEIILCALALAPSTLWQGAEYVTLQPVQELESVRKEFFDCQDLLWKHFFPESYKIEQSNPGLIWAHAFKGLDDNLPETTATQYFEQLYRCFTSCGRNCGRKKSAEPRVFLMEPRKRLFQFSLSPDFRGIFNVSAERRIIRYPIIEAVNNVMPWAAFIPTTFPCSRYVTAIQPEKISKKPVAGKHSKNLKDLAISLKANEVSRLTDETHELNKTIDALEQKISALTKNMKSDEEKFILLQEQHNSASRELKGLKDDLSEQNLRSLKQEKDSLSKLLKDEKDKSTGLRVNVEQLTSELNRTTILLKEIKEKFASTTQAHNLSLEELQQDKEFQIKNLNEQVRLNKIEIENLNKTILELKKKLKNKGKNQKRQLTEALQNQKAEKEKLEKELNEKQAQLEIHITAANQFLAAQETKQEDEEQVEQNSNLEIAYQDLLIQTHILQANLHQAGQLVQHLTHWCSYLQQGWSNATSQPTEKIITVEGEDFCLTTAEQEQILREHLLINVIQKRERD